MSTLTRHPCASAVARLFAETDDSRAKLEQLRRPSALIVADNADWSPEYLARVRDRSGGYLSVPFTSDVELSMKL